MIEVLKTAQLFAPIDGSIQFNCTRVLFLRDGMTFCAKPPMRIGKRYKIDLDTLEDIRPIPPEPYQPLYTSDYTIASHPDRCFSKKPNLTSFMGGAELCDYVLLELATCELIRNQPHRNIATYHGCEVFDGRVIGLCFEKYEQTLLERVNPSHLNKKAARYLSGIEEGIRHLHSLGRNHNDINPANIMFREDDTPVITDFDSSSAPGTELDKAKRTYGWYDPDVTVSQAANDFKALAELRTWLTGSEPAEFQFGW
ncbi:uncharacterized protein K460DRAFT_278849 [Cucurbitaria berberidis CBS 394.84]|uniref:Protein kinase domain-containing protein n=1 Tax=Cucurbitaria berberidis CBS 394.84 TaxID=1168544 RepID=A0A9P4GL85_9PLEO|nr:uncharacterized protein K460DRAFT_278849 [Cucurbitaria berberidis CBS 394.84]KAF1847712.1 hypothetical protein K460DRAFT_278849 [Cucurbitaria berberidis CBS 394.84]